MVVEWVPHMLKIILPSSSDLPVWEVIKKNVFEAIKWNLLDVNAKTNFNEPPFLNLEYLLAHSSQLNLSLGMYTQS